MKIDFSTPMTFYELVAIILAAVALIIPIIQAVWKKWLVAAKLSFLPIGRAQLFFNQSGSYIRVDGVYESEKKPISIKKIGIKVTRKRDERKLNLTWSCFISPVNQNVIGNYLHTMESAHPIRIEADSINCAFIEFGDAFDSFGKTFKTSTQDLFGKIEDIRNTYKNYIDAVAFYKSTPEYARAKDVLNREFFWEIGQYDIDIEVSYNKTVEHFYYTISVGEYEHDLLMNNIDESLISSLKSNYSVNWDYRTAVVELKDVKAK